MFKKFNKELFKKHDAKGKEVVASLFESFGYVVEPNTKYGIDLIGDKDGMKELIEVDHHASWHGRVPYDPMHITTRKQKWIDDIDFFFAVVNSECDCVIIVKSSLIRKCPILTTPNKYVKDEKCYHVPRAYFLKYYYTNPPELNGKGAWLNDGSF